MNVNLTFDKHFVLLKEYLGNNKDKSIFMEYGKQIYLISDFFDLLDEVGFHKRFRLVK